MTDADRRRDERDAALPADVVLSPIWRRLLAQVIDQLIVLAPVAVGFAAGGVSSLDEVEDHAVAINAAVVAVAFVYEYLMIGRWGRTVGKFATGIRVVRSDTGGRVLWYSSAIRALVPLAAGVIPSIGVFLSVFIYVRALFDRRRQGWHDRAAGTIVIMHRSGPSPEQWPTA